MVAGGSDISQKNRIVEKEVKTGAWLRQCEGNALWDCGTEVDIWTFRERQSS